jgi:PncC family amidohydrolase
LGLEKLFTDSEHLAAQILFELKKRKLRLVVAESCTGGLISAALTQISGSSSVFWGGVIAYSNDLKIQLLNVSKELLTREGAVSSEVALEMAKGACRALQSDIAISVTGVAGPSGGTEAKPVGTVWFGFCGPNFQETQLQFFKGSRSEIQSQSVLFVLRRLLKLITNP